MTTRRKSAIYKSILVISIIGGAAAMKGCSSDAVPGANEVIMRAIAFEPAEITIQAGESVTWTNQDAMLHTVTSGNPGDDVLEAIFRSEEFGQGGTFTHTFEDPGEFLYYCELHPDIMRDAKVIVESGN